MYTSLLWSGLPRLPPASGMTPSAPQQPLLQAHSQTMLAVVISRRSEEIEERLTRFLKFNVLRVSLTMR